MPRARLGTLTTDTVADGVVVLTLDRPDRGNGVVPEMAADLVETLSALEADTGVRAGVLTGAGAQFSAGPTSRRCGSTSTTNSPVPGSPTTPGSSFRSSSRWWPPGSR